MITNNGAKVWGFWDYANGPITGVCLWFSTQALRDWAMKRAKAQAFARKGKKSATLRIFGVERFAHEVPEAAVNACVGLAA